MAKRRVKKRTHIPNQNGRSAAPGNTASKPGSRTPKSMVIRIGASSVGPAVSQLVRDVRSVLEPQTASRLKERRGNKLRDFTTMAGPLGVTHLLLFSRSEGKAGKAGGNVNMRLAVTPRGPTMHFRVESYSLCKDVAKVQKRPKGKPQGEFLAPPLLVMNNFSTKEQEQNGELDGETGKKAKENAVPKHLESLATTVFQSLFPPINPVQTPLSSIKRVLMLDRKPQTSSATSDSDSIHPYVLNLRHYAITTRTAKSVAKPLRRLDAAEKVSHAGEKRKRGGVPNLGKLHDVADYLLDPQAADGFTSASDSEPDTDAEVEVLAPAQQKVRDRREKKKAAEEADGEGAARTSDRRDPAYRAQARVERKGIKLQELGPRLRLRLTKVEEGMCGGKVMWHEYIHKSDAEVRQMEKVHQQKRQERERRREEQKENVERKREERKADDKEANGEDEEDLDEDEDMWDDYEHDEEMDDVEDEDSEGGVELGAADSGSDDNGE
ncbi:rRNA-binding ribosome biosynthesis protein [Saxophila tyrrhenica]|uniref:rRNA-binding ribosome biosynthesis protein n=1 Tax=Saxophila tyrrhenica TaxID=1690608 RepID=A0AAV9PDM4_9PEZI|nr:rRNA-binding ribosome biosynthesis protein [Saxophila tyrrhenica]